MVHRFQTTLANQYQGGLHTTLNTSAAVIIAAKGQLHPDRLILAVAIFPQSGQVPDPGFAFDDAFLVRVLARFQIRWQLP
ncbi:hypothetical protein Y5W_03253 [Alcanivorax sp. 521-1]|uniref:Uncharacterized protein n=1 Tax=Alloalcanivorax profundimaris TaxID=2735259 RepID=A0ABS0AUY9_9GAMM|nr:hypothetical protein [Alloalcanivorax profundimaris]